MPTHDPDTKSKKDEYGPGYETSDANVKDTAIFLLIMGASIAVVFVLAFGIGKLIYFGLARQDGPTNKWSQMAGAKPANLESDPQIQQQQLQQMVKRFPTPRLQTDDGNMDVAQMHAREDMLLNYYSWINQQAQTVRIPIDRAMQLLAQRGLPVEGQVATETKPRQQPSAKSDGTDSSEQPMFGDASNVVTAPLTDGFARTGPELQMMQVKQQQLESGADRDTHAELQSGR